MQVVAKQHLLATATVIVKSKQQHQGIEILLISHAYIFN